MHRNVSLESGRKKGLLLLHKVKDTFLASRALSAAYTRHVGWGVEEEEEDRAQGSCRRRSSRAESVV